MFEINAIKAVKRDLKRIDPEAVKEIEAIHLKHIRENPFESHDLGYAFKGLRSYHFDYKGTSYRIVYEVFEEDGLVVIVMIAPRESFYERLKRRLA